MKSIFAKYNLLRRDAAMNPAVHTVRDMERK